MKTAETKKATHHKHLILAISAMLALSMLLTGCMGDEGTGGVSLATATAPERVVMQIINNSCNEVLADAESTSTGQVKGLSKVMNGFGIPYDEYAPEYQSVPQPVTDDSYDANKNRGIGYAGLESHYPGEIKGGWRNHKEDAKGSYTLSGAGQSAVGAETMYSDEWNALSDETKDQYVYESSMWENLTPEEEMYGCCMRWEYSGWDGGGIDGYYDFVRGSEGSRQYVAIHALNTDKWVIACPFDYGPSVDLPVTGSGHYGRIGGVSPEVAEALGFGGHGECPDEALTEWWWVENSSQVKCGPVEDLSSLTNGGSSSASSASSASSGTTATTGTTATVSTGIITGVLGAGGSSSQVAIEPANPNSFVKSEQPEWQHGDLPKNKVKYIMMHDTESGTDSAERIIAAWGGNHVAAHFMVDKDGKIFQCVPIDKIAHHAGESGQEGSNEKYGITQERDDLVGSVTDTDYAMNAWSIGIEIVHEHDEGEYPNAQLNAIDRLVAYIDQEVGSQPKIIDHKSWSSYKQDVSDDFPLKNYQDTRNHSAVTTIEEAKQAAQAGECSDGDAEEEGEISGDSIADAAVLIAGTASPDAAIPGSAEGEPTDPKLKEYVDAHKKLLTDYGQDNIYASCDRGACTAIRLSEADKTFPYGNCSELLAYCKGSPKWKEKGTWRMGDSADVLEPGDVLVCDGHIKIFTGNEAVKKKFPSSDANMMAASYGQHQPWCYNESTSYDYREYSIFTCVKPDTPQGTSRSDAVSNEAQALIDKAHSIIGSGYSEHGYVWTGDVNSSVFTCSGVPDYCLGLPSQSNSPETYWAQIESAGNFTTNVSDLRAGDLVFYPYGGRSPCGHVGIYIGNNQIIDSIPNGGVQIRDVNYMTCLGGGPIVSGGENASASKSPTNTQKNTKNESTKKKDRKLDNGKRQKIIDFAKSQLGVPYNYDGAWNLDIPNQQMACNGLTRWAYDAAGIQIPQGSVDQMLQMPIIHSTGKVSDLQPGDIVCYDDTSSDDSKTPTGNPLRTDISYTITSYRHVAIYIGDGQIIEEVPGQCIQSALSDNAFSFGGCYDGLGEYEEGTEEEGTEGAPRYNVHVSRAG